MSGCRWKSRSRCRAFTLLEVVLALAILAGSIAVLGEIMRSAGRRAADAQNEMLAQQLACSLMDEVVCGRIEAVDQMKTALEVDDPTPWVYSLTITETIFAGLTSVEVVVEQDLEKAFSPVKYRLVRWVSSVSGSSSEESEEEDGGGDA